MNIRSVAVVNNYLLRNRIQQRILSALPWNRNNMAGVATTTPTTTVAAPVGQNDLRHFSSGSTYSLNSHNTNNDKTSVAVASRSITVRHMTTATTHSHSTEARTSPAKHAPMIPRKAAVQLTESARTLFRQMLAKPPRPDIAGILLNFHQSQSGEPRMVFSFTFVTQDELQLPEHRMAEGVSLEIVPSNSATDPAAPRTMVPKPPAESWNDGLPKLYIHQNALLKVLGATIDLRPDNPADFILYDREGNVMDPNA